MSDYQSAQFPPQGEISFAAGDISRTTTHPEVSKRCDAFIKEQLNAISKTPLSNEEKQAIESLIKKNVVKLMQHALPEVEKGLATLGQQVKGYQRVNYYITSRFKEIAKKDFTDDEKKVMSQKLLEGGAAVLADIRDGNLQSLADIDKKIEVIDRSLSETEQKPISRSGMVETAELAELKEKRVYEKQLDPNPSSVTCSLRTG